MKHFLNIYMVLFLIDGTISLSGTVTRHLFGVQLSYFPQQLIAFVVVLMSLPMYIMTGCVRGLPKGVVLPMVLFTVWVSVFKALPLPIYLGLQNTITLASVFQLCLGIVLLLILRYRDKHKQWLYTASVVEKLSFRWKRLVGFMAINVILILPLIGLYLGISLRLGVSHFSRGFMRLDATGVTLEARTYLYEDKYIHLLPTAHIARPTFYNELVDPLPYEHTVILPEGITDEKKILKDGIRLTKIAEKLGLESQDNQVIVAKRPTAYCDVDVSDFSPGTIDYLKTCVRVSKHLTDGKLDLAIQVMFSAPEPDLNVLWNDILVLRNQRVIACMTEQLKTYEHIAIPWGAAHMPGIERTLFEMGAKVVDQRDIRVWDWSSKYETEGN